MVTITEKRSIDSAGVTLTGCPRHAFALTTDYERGLARLVQHEIDHLDGHLYTARMRPGVQPISVTEYRQTGRAWIYER
ncbi:peptide deformylase [Streptomyces mutabilis]|uniref:peptide deformylase n=1 Tax=Streptomyces mutabilis TaxID=67332 RepID=UPI0036ABD237